MSARHSAQKTDVTSRRREVRVAPAEWRAQAMAEQPVDATTETAHDAPGEDGSPELISARAQWVCLGVAAVLTVLVLVGRLTGWLV